MVTRLQVALVPALLALACGEGTLARRADGPPASDDPGRAELTFDVDVLDLAVHAPGVSACSEVALANTGELPVRVRDVHLQEAGGVFSARHIGAIAGATLEPGAFRAFEVCFTPLEIGASYGDALIVVTDAGVFSLAVTGRGGAARIVAVPDHLDLGVAGAGEIVNRRVELRNMGEATPVTVRGVASSYRDGSMVLQHPALPFDAGRGGPFAVDVSFAGVGPGPHSGVITVTLEDETGVGRTLEVPVAGEITAELPCVLVVDPTEVRFGVVRAGRDPDTGEQVVHGRELRLRNAGSESCFVRDLRLDPAGSPSFSIGGSGGSFSIAPDEDIVILVTFTPEVPSVQPEVSALVFHQAAGADEVRVPISGFGSDGARE